MDEQGMRDRLTGYLAELDWSGGATRAAISAHLLERDRSLARMVDEYVAEGSYADAAHLLTVIPEQAWQAVQGDRWQGAETQFGVDTPSGFHDSPATRDERGS